MSFIATTSFLQRYHTHLRKGAFQKFAPWGSWDVNVAVIHWWGLKEIIRSETRFEPRTPGWKSSATVSFQPSISTVPTLIPLSIIAERIVHRQLHIHHVVGSNLSLGNIIHSWNLHLNSQPAASYCFVMVWICKRVVSSLEAVVPKRD